MIKRIKMDWETEIHQFTFESGGDRIGSIDFLRDLIGSLETLRREIQETPSSMVPHAYEVWGDGQQTVVKSVGGAHEYD